MTKVEYDETDSFDDYDEPNNNVGEPIEANYVLHDTVYMNMGPSCSYFCSE